MLEHSIDKVLIGVYLRTTKMWLLISITKEWKRSSAQELSNFNQLARTGSSQAPQHDGKSLHGKLKKVAGALQTVSRKWLIVKQTRVKVGDGSVYTDSVEVLQFYTSMLHNIEASLIPHTRSKTPKPHRKTVAWVDYVHLASKCGSEVSP